MPRDQVVMAWQSVAKVLGIAPWPDVLTFLQVSILFWLCFLLLRLLKLLFWQRRLRWLLFLMLWELGIGSKFVLVGSVTIIISTALLAHVLLKRTLSIFKVDPGTAWVLDQHLALPSLLRVGLYSTLNVALQHGLQRPRVCPRQRVLHLCLILLDLWAVRAFSFILWAALLLLVLVAHAWFQHWRFLKI